MHSSHIVQFTHCLNRLFASLSLDCAGLESKEEVFDVKFTAVFFIFAFVRRSCVKMEKRAVRRTGSSC